MYKWITDSISNVLFRGQYLPYYQNISINYIRKLSQTSKQLFNAENFTTQEFRHDTFWSSAVILTRRHIWPQ